MGRRSSEFANILENLIQSTPQQSAQNQSAEGENNPPAPTTQHIIWQWNHPSPEGHRSRQGLGPYQNLKPKPSPPPLITLVKEVPSRPERFVELAKIPKEARHAAEHLYRLAEQSCPAILKEFEVRKLYRRLARRLHPDAHIHAPGHENTKRNDQFRGLKASYDTLKIQFKA